MTNSLKLPTDTYYRGYRISQNWVSEATSRGEVIMEAHWVYRVYFGTDWVNTYLDIEDAKSDIDDWQNAK